MKANKSKAKNKSRKSKSRRSKKNPAANHYVKTSRNTIKKISDILTLIILLIELSKWISHMFF